MRQSQSRFYGEEVPDKVEKALDKLMKAFANAQNAKTKQERSLAKTNLAIARDEYRKVVHKVFKTNVLALA